MARITKLVEEIIKEIPKNSRDASIYAVESGSFNDSRKYVYLVSSNEIEGKFKGTIVKGICFNNNLRQKLVDEKITRVYVGLDGCTKPVPKITSEEKRQWIKLAKKHNLLPKYVKEAWVDKGKYVINLNVKGMSPSLLYSYLSVIRYIRDETAFVKSILIMVDHGVNYYIAFVFASRMYIHNTGHHIINVGRTYPHINIEKPVEMLGINLEVGTAASLKRYFDNPGKWDKRKVSDIQKSGWNCHTKIRSAAKSSAIVKVSKLFDPSIIKTVMGD